MVCHDVFLSRLSFFFVFFLSSCGLPPHTTYHSDSIADVVGDDLVLPRVGVVVGERVVHVVGVGAGELEVTLADVEVGVSSLVVRDGVVVNPMRCIISLRILRASMRRSCQFQISASSSESGPSSVCRLRCALRLVVSRAGSGSGSGSGSSSGSGSILGPSRSPRV